MLEEKADVKCKIENDDKKEKKTYVNSTRDAFAENGSDSWRAISRVWVCEGVIDGCMRTWCNDTFTHDVMIHVHMT